MIFVIVSMIIIFGVNIALFRANRKILDTIAATQTYIAETQTSIKAIEDILMPATSDIRGVQVNVRDMNGDVRRLEAQVKGLPGQVKKAVSEGILSVLPSGGARDKNPQLINEIKESK